LDAVFLLPTCALCDTLNIEFVRMNSLLMA